jgi:hypothetical protein
MNHKNQNNVISLIKYVVSESSLQMFEVFIYVELQAGQIW